MSLTNTLNITDQTPLGALTVGQFKQFFKPEPIQEEVQPEVEMSEKYVYGLKGIRELFNVSHVTAQRYKDTFLSEAIIQHGRKIVVDKEKALKLFAKKGGCYGKYKEYRK